MITVLSVYGPATVQDLGWLGYYRDGVSRCGAMDRLALALGNILLGNPEGAAAIEVPLPPLHLRFETDISFAVTGADCGAELDGRPLPPYWATHARAGQELRLGRARSGGFSYIAVHGGIDVPQVLGARSTHLRGGFGGFNGRALLPGDKLTTIGHLADLPPGGIGTQPLPPLEGSDGGNAVRVRVLPASEYEYFAEESQARFWNGEWGVSPQSNRAGYRLDGDKLPLVAAMEMRSHGVLPGTIQVPAGGTPIIQLADAATMGGYPKIGVVIEADLWRIAQTKVGDRLRFVQVDYEEAVAAEAEVDAFLTECRQFSQLIAQSAQRLR